MSQVVFIAGMHRSGTSMFARLLNLCGVYLGSESDLLPPQPENREGYWENRQFMLLNDELLSELGGGWDYPPKVDSGWEKSSKFSHIRFKASELIQQFSDHKHWGWKDPRNSLTLPFWKELIPSMKVVICVRNPLEVANSLLERNYFSRASAFNLWFEYNQRILLYGEPENRIITHYDSYFHDPHLELTRILKFLELDVSERLFMESLDTVYIQLRHHQSTLLDLMSEAPPKIINLYQKMCGQTAEISQLSSDFSSETQTPFDENLQDENNAEKNLKLLSKELISAKKYIVEKEQNAQILKAQLDVREKELVDKEQNAQTLKAQLDIREKELVQKEQSAQILKAQLDVREKELADIYRSKAWHFIQTVRRIRKKVTG